MQSPDARQRVALRAEPSAEGEGGEGGARRPDPSPTHRFREASIFRVFCGVKVSVTPSMFFVALSTTKSFSPEATARMYQDPRS